MAQSSFTDNLEIFDIYRATKALSVHENDQHVQGWNPDDYYFSKIEHNGTWQTCNLHHTSNITQCPIFKVETYLV